MMFAAEILQLGEDRKKEKESDLMVKRKSPMQPVATHGHSTSINWRSRVNVWQLEEPSNSLNFGSCDL